MFAVIPSVNLVFCSRESYPPRRWNWMQTEHSVDAACSASPTPFGPFSHKCWMRMAAARKSFLRSRLSPLRAPCRLPRRPRLPTVRHAANSRKAIWHHFAVIVVNDANTTALSASPASPPQFSNSTGTLDQYPGTGVFSEIGDQICSLLIRQKTSDLALKRCSFGDRDHWQLMYAIGVVVKCAFSNVTPS